MNVKPRTIRGPMFLIAANRRNDPVSGKPRFSDFYLRVVNTPRGRPAKLLPIFTSEQRLRQFASLRSTIPRHAAKFNTSEAIGQLLCSLKPSGVELVCFDTTGARTEDDVDYVPIDDAIQLFL